MSTIVFLLAAPGGLFSWGGRTRAAELSVQPAPRRSRLLVAYVAGNDPTSRKRQVHVEEMWHSLEVARQPRTHVCPLDSPRGRRRGAYRLAETVRARMQRETTYWSLRCLVVTGGHLGSGEYEYRSDPAHSP